MRISENMPDHTGLTPNPTVSLSKTGVYRGKHYVGSVIRWLKNIDCGLLVRTASPYGSTVPTIFFFRNQKKKNFYQFYL